MWTYLFILIAAGHTVNAAMNATEKSELRSKVLEMFRHAYDSYMTYAYPADELMPLSCQGRYRGSHKSRGDVDDALGNFSLTLIDTLDTLAVLGELDEFEDSVKRVINDVTFDTDVTVSVFETNIRVVGGLLGGHVMARHVQRTRAPRLSWYEDELLSMAADVARRLLPAFNTTTGIPYPRVNLRYGLTESLRSGKDTCTACAGTIILEFAALSRMTGETVFEEKAKRALSYLWRQRHRVSDLMGTVINIHNGDWVRRDSGVGAGIDSYYEYLLKAYVLLGDHTYLDRFTKHYESVMRYMNQGPMLVDVHMHRPTTTSRHFMDSLQAFWPGLQVLHGDVKPAIQHHEMLYQLVQRHKFLPEAFTTDFRVHWAHHPLRPEFLESTYFLYKATGDDHYLEVGRTVLENLEKHGRVKCGFAAIKDVTTGQHDDQMDSYVLAETFKYFWLLFSEDHELILDVDDYVFTTEAHLLPLTLSMHNFTKQEHHATDRPPPMTAEVPRSCASPSLLFPDRLQFASSLREPLRDYVAKICPKHNTKEPGLRARDFVAGNADQLHQLRRMGIKIVTMDDGRVQLLHTASEAATQADAEEGMVFMQEMIELSKQQQQQVTQDPVHVQLLTMPYFGSLSIGGGPAQFGLDLHKHGKPIKGRVVVGSPYDGCSEFANTDLAGTVVIVQRGGCLFVDKARHIQKAGGAGGIVIDNVADTSMESSLLFSMSGDGRNDVAIPMVFLFAKEGSTLLHAADSHSGLEVALTSAVLDQDVVMKEILERRRQLSEDLASTQETIQPLPPTARDVLSEADTSPADSPVSQSEADTPSTQTSDGQSAASSASSYPSAGVGDGRSLGEESEETADYVEDDGSPGTAHVVGSSKLEIKIRGGPHGAVPPSPGVETVSDGLDQKLRIDLDQLFDKPRQELQYEEITHKILSLLSHTLQHDNYDYIHAVTNMINAALQTMDIQDQELTSEVTSHEDVTSETVTSSEDLTSVEAPAPSTSPPGVTLNVNNNDVNSYVIDEHARDVITENDDVIRTEKIAPVPQRVFDITTRKYVDVKSSSSDSHSKDSQSKHSKDEL